MSWRRRRRKKKDLWISDNEEDEEVLQFWDEFLGFSRKMTKLDVRFCWGLQ